MPAALPPVTKPASPPNENVPDSPGENAYNSPPPLSTLDSEVPIKSMSSKKNQVPIFAGVIGCVVFLVISTIGIYLCKTNKVAIVRPWTTGISGQLQKALVTGKYKHFILLCLYNKTWSFLVNLWFPGKSNSCNLELIRR